MCFSLQNIQTQIRSQTSHLKQVNFIQKNHPTGKQCTNHIIHCLTHTHTHTMCLHLHHVGPEQVSVRITETLYIVSTSLFYSIHPPTQRSNTLYNDYISYISSRRHYTLIPTDALRTFCLETHKNATRLYTILLYLSSDYRTSCYKLLICVLVYMLITTLLFTFVWTVESGTIHRYNSPQCYPECACSPPLCLCGVSSHRRVDRRYCLSGETCSGPVCVCV